MLRRTCLTAAVALPLAATAALAASGGWPQVWDRLDSWEGASKVVVASDYANPYGVPAFQKLVNGLLDRGFTVLQSKNPKGLSSDAGLHAELRKTGSGPVLAITRRSNGAIVALAPVKGAPKPGGAQASASGGQQTAGGGTRTTTGTSQPTATQAGGAQPTQQASKRPSRLDVQGHPRRLAVTSAPGQPLSVALLYPNRVTVAALDRGQLVRRATHRPDGGTGKALYVGTGDVNGDGAAEVAATWGQDVTTSKATITRVHSRVFRAPGLEPVSGRTDGFMRVIGDRLYGQGRGETEIFAGNVMRLRLDGGDLTRAAPQVSFAGANLYASTPLGNGAVATWSGPGRLRLASGGGASVSASPAMGLGKMLFPGLMTKRAEPKVISGPEADYGTEYDKRVALPRRVRVGPDGAIYTIERKRSPGLMGLTGSRGQDRVVRLALTQRGLRQQGGFPPLDWFVLDFDLVELEQGGPAAVVLANRSRDGSGAAAIFLMGFPES